MMSVALLWTGCVVTPDTETDCALCILTCMGGVSYTVSGVTSPPTLSFATPTFVRFSGFMDLKW